MSMQPTTSPEPEKSHLVREGAKKLEAAVRTPKTAWGKALLDVVGTADDLPPDFSVNHDYYLYGIPKRR